MGRAALPQQRGRVHAAIHNFFRMDEKGTQVSTELRAGLVSFLTSSYILLVNPQILAQAGIPSHDVAVATAISSGIASIMCGLTANLPFGLAPGTGLSAYVTYGLVLSGNLSRQQAMTACLISGLTLGVCATVGISDVIMKVIPRSIKMATVVGMGLLIALIGMVSIHLVVPNKETLVTLGSLKDYHIWLSLLGLVAIGTLLFHQVKGGVLLGMVALTGIVWAVDRSWPTKFADMPSLQLGVMENIGFKHLSLEMVPAILAFLLVGIFDVSGVMFGLSALAHKTHEPREHHQVPGSLWVFLSTSVGTIVAAMAGCSPIIIHVESASGIREGGRTGFTAVVVGVLFLASVFLAPVFSHVPNAATAPILILVGAMMISESQNVDWADMSQAIPAFLTSMMMPFTWSIPNGILFGLGSSFAFFITTGEFLRYLRGWGRGGDAEKLVNGNAPPDENTGLTGEFPERRPSLFDEHALVRRLSLIVPKGEADEVEFEFSPIAVVAPKKEGYGGGDHMQTVNL